MQSGREGKGGADGNIGADEQGCTDGKHDRNGKGNFDGKCGADQK